MSIGAPGGIDRGHGLGVAHGAARLGKGPDTGRQAQLDGVGEREERVRCARGPRRGGDAKHRVRLGDGLSRRVHARGLAAAHPHEPALAHEDDRVRSHAADQAPREVQIELLLVGRRAARGARPCRRSIRDDVGGGHENGAAGRPDRPDR